MKHFSRYTRIVMIAKLFGLKFKKLSKNGYEYGWYKP